MNLTAGVRTLLIKAAHKNPSLRANILSLVADPNFEIHHDLSGQFKGKTAMEKKAITKETEVFIAWCLAKKAVIKSAKFEKIVERLTGMEASSAPITKKSGPLGVGEQIIVDKHKNTNAANVDVCDTWHNKQGVVESIDDANDVTVVAFGSTKIEFDGRNAGKDTGLYRNSNYSVDGKKTHVESVYVKGTIKAPPLRDREQMKEYIDRGIAKGQHRDLRYYSGVIAIFRYNKKNQVYIGINTPQRNHPVNVNPDIGTLYYLGAVGKRPSGWKREAAEWGMIA